MNWSSWRIVAASVAVTGIVAGGTVDIARAVRLGEDVGLVMANYFSYFTIVSAVSTVIVFFVAARRNGPLATKDGVESRSLAVALATTSTAMIILAIVYNGLLRGLPVHFATPDPSWVAFLDRWATETLHVIVPIYIVIDVFFAPRRRVLTWRALVGIVGIPLLWALYTMLRGPLTPDPDGTAPYWYPYPFLNPNSPAGYQTPMMYIGVIAAAFLVVGGVLVLLTHRRHGAARPSRTSRASQVRPRIGA